MRGAFRGISFAVVAALVLMACKNSRAEQIRRNPQTADHRAAAQVAGAIAAGARGAMLDGGASAGDPSQFGCQSRDYSDAQVTAAVRAKLADLQRQSFRSGVEYCGFAYIGASCQIEVSQTTRGTAHSCNQTFSTAVVRLAFYHTHGVGDGSNAGEIPSDTDFRGAIAARTNSYVATPSGRLWRIDAFDQVARLECRTCLPSSPGSRFQQQLFSVGTSYSFAQLLTVLRENGLRSGG